MVFKWIGKFNIDRLQALIINYITAFILGYNLSVNRNFFFEVTTESWFYGSAILGILFIVVFYLMVQTTQHHGIGVVSVASKMSLSLPVIFVILYYDEPLNFLKIVGILLAIAKAAGFITLLPFLVFLGSGVVESSIKYLEETFVKDDEVAYFSSSVFLFAGITGIVAYFVQSFIRFKKFSWKSVIGGIALGIPNYFSIHFFVNALRAGDFTDAAVFVINNVAIVLLSTLIGILVFSEKLEKQNRIGVLLAIISIGIVAIASYQV
jgi:uncharacterized membrane protein